MATDKYGIVPDGFIDEIDDASNKDISTLEEALEYAHTQMPSSTDDKDQPRCRYCGGIRLRSKPGTVGAEGIPHRKNHAQYKCTTCGTHQTERAPPAAEAPNLEFVDDKDTPFIWETKSDLADPADRGDSHQLHGLDDDRLTALAILLYRPWDDDGPSYRTLTDIIPHSHEWIGMRVRDWRDGEYRDLVANPNRPTATAAGRSVVATDGGTDAKRRNGME